MNLRLSKLVLPAALVIILFQGCGTGRVRSLMGEAESVLEESPEEALSLVRSIDTTAIKTRRLRAEYSLLLAKALDKNWIDTTDAGVIMPAVEYYSVHKPLSKRAEAYYYLGTIQFNSKDHQDACLSLMRAERYCGQAGDERLRSLIYNALSTIFSNASLYEEALRYDTLSRDLSVLTGDSLGAGASTYGMARDLGNLGRVREADSLFRKVSRPGAVHANLRWRVLSGYGVLLASGLEDFKGAVDNFEEAIQEFGTLPDEVSWSAYAYSLLRIGRVDESDNFFGELELMDSEDLLAFKKWKAMAEAYKGEYSSAYHWLDLESDIQLRNVQLVLKQSVVKAQRDGIAIEREEAEHKASRRKWFALSLAVVIALLIVGAFLAFRRLRIRQARERESLLDLQRVMSDRILGVENERDSIRKRYIEMCRSHFSQTGRIAETMASSRETDSRLYRQLKRNVQILQESEESQMEFEAMLNSSFDNLMVHFREAFPGRKPRFYRLASYLFASFDSATISVLISELSKDNVYVEKSRLKSLIKDSDSPYKADFLALL